MTGGVRAEHANISGMAARLMAEGYATLHELNTVYGTRAVLDMYEVLAVRHYNLWEASEWRSKARPKR